MNDLGVIDRFLDVFSRYIDSGFGLLQGEVSFLTATLVAIDLTLAGLFWAMSHASGSGDDVLSKLIRKILYIGSFAFIIGNFNTLAGIIFRSFAGLGLLAAGSPITEAQLLQPGRLAQVGVDAAKPILAQIGEMAGFPEFFLHVDQIVVLFLAWLVVIVSFFVLAVQLFVTLIEFKLTTLAGFVLVPFALWGKTSFLAEKVLGNVVSSGVKVLVLAVIVGVGSVIFAEFKVPPGAEPSIDHALAIMLGSLALLGLSIFGPGIATGLVSGAPQLGAGAAAGAALAAGGLAVAGFSAARAGAGAMAAGARMAPAAALTAIGRGGAIARSGAALAKDTNAAFQLGAAASGASGVFAAGAGVAQVARTGASALGRRVAAGASAFKNRIAAAASGTASAAPPSDAASSAPDWAKRLRTQQAVAHGASVAAHVLRSSDHGGGAPSPTLRE